MGSIWYVCKFCQRALTSSHQLKVHKLANHLPELLRLKEEKKAAAELLLQTQSRQKIESGTIRNETLDLEETGPPESSYINASQKEHKGSNCSDIGIKTSALSVCLEPNLGFDSLNSIPSRYVKADQNPNPPSDTPANTYPDKNYAETNNGTETAADANDAAPGQTRLGLADVKIEIDSTDSLSPNEFQAVSQQLNLIGSEPVTPEEVESISIEVEVPDQFRFRPVQNISNATKADDETDFSRTPLAYVDYLFRKYQLQEHFYRDHGRLTLTCSYCPSGLRYKYFKWALNHMLLHTETLESKNCLEQLRECCREYSKGPPKVTSSVRRPALHSKKDEGSFGCSHCGKRFSQKFGLRFHLKNYHCSSTKRRTTETKELTTNTNTQRPLTNPGIQAYRRVPVIMEHVSPKNLAQARGAGDADSTSRCTVQVKAYPNPRNQNDPALSTKKGNFVCPTCKKKFKLKLDLSAHVEEHPKKSSRQQSRHRRLEHKPQEEQTKCTLCGKGFTNRSELERHTMEVHTNKSHDCEYCGKSFSTHWALGYHLKMHLQRNFMIRRVNQRKITFACQSPGCPEVLDTAELLDIHFKCTHVFACQSPGCQKVFDKANMLALHFKYMHTNHTKYPNTNITAEKAGPIVLVPNATVRTIEPPKPPTGVIEIAKPAKESSSAAVIPYRQRHWKKAVLGREDLGSNINHYCSECDLSFKDTFELEIHIQSHNGFAIQLAYCTFCGKMFSTARCLELHIEQHRDGLIPCACQQCHQVYPSVSNFNYHMLTAHKRQEA